MGLQSRPAATSNIKYQGENGMYSRKLALSQAKKYRTCPPPHIADSPSHKEYLRQHLEICPYCSAQVMEDHKNWGYLAEQIQDFFPPPSRANEIKDEGLPGQIRHIRADLGRWCGGYFYNPPLILILETVTEHPDTFLVAQMYHDMYLSGPGDLILSDEQTETEELFVECWNTYVAEAASLETPIGKVGPEIIESVKQLGQNPHTYPDWAIQPRPLTNYDARIYFRELETQVGLFFRNI